MLIGCKKVKEEMLNEPVHLEKNPKRDLMEKVKSGFMKLVTKENKTYQSDRKEREKYLAVIPRGCERVEKVEKCKRDIEENLAECRAAYKSNGTRCKRHKVVMAQGYLRHINDILKQLKDIVNEDKKLFKKFDKRKERVYFWQ